MIAQTDKALVYDILPPATAIVYSTIGLKILSHHSVSVS